MRINAPAGVLVALALVSALVVLGAVTSPAVAQTQGDNISVERTGDNLVLTVDNNRTGEFDSIRLVVKESDGTEAVNETLSTDADSVTEVDNETAVELDLFDFPGSLTAAQNLSAATVDVALERDGSVVDTATAQRNLAAVRFDGASVSFEDGALNVTATDLVGADGTVPIRLAGETTVDVASKGVDTWALSIPLAEAQPTSNIFEPFTVVAFPDSDAQKTVIEELDLQDRVGKPTITADSDAGALTLEYDLIFAGGEYNVTVADETREVTASSYGRLDLSEIAETVLLSGNTTLSVEQDGTSIRDGIRVPFDDSEVFAVARAEAGGPSFGPDHRTVSHPLLFPGERYGVTIETTEPEGQWTGELQANESGLTLPDSATSAFVADTVTVSVTSPDGYTLFDGSQLFEGDPGDALTPVTEGTASMDGKRLNLSATDVGLDGVETVWLRHNGTLSRLDATRVNHTAGFLNLSGVAQTPNEDGTVSMALFGSGGAVLERLDVTVTGATATESSASSLFTVPEGWVMPFGLAWFAGASLVALLLVIFKILRVPVVGEPGGYGLFALGAGNALGLSFLVYFLEPRVEFGLGVVGATSLVVAAFLGLERKPMDLRALVIGLMVGTFATGVSLIVGATMAQPVLGISVGTGYGTLAGGALVLWYGKYQSDAQEQAAESGETPVDVEIALVDTLTGEPLDIAAEVTARRADTRNARTRSSRRTTGSSTRNTPSATRTTSNPQTLSVRNGTAKGSLIPGSWEFEVKTQGATVTRSRQIGNVTNTVQLKLPGKELAVQVQGDGEPITNAEVRAESAAYTDTGPTDSDGRYRATLPMDASAVEITAEHELYKADTVSVDASRENEATVTLEPREGQLHTTVTLGGDAVSGVTVKARRQSRPRRTESGTTDERGVVEFRGLLIGSYDLTVDLPTTSGAFSVAEQSVRIEEEARERQDVTVSFEYSLSGAHTRRIRELRGELDEIARSSRRDDAIQGYYASVLHAVLDEIERVPRAGHPFLEYRTEPDDAVEALLTAVEEATETVDTVLTSQRNVNLFSACSDLPQAAVEWRGNVDIAAMLEAANRDVGQQRAEINEQLEDVDETISAELRELAEVSPAREMWEGLRDLLRDQGGLDELEVAASIFVAGLLLDAVGSVFEHRELRKRLEQTVY